MTVDFIQPFYQAFLIGYFLGSIPFGFIITKLAGEGDLRQIGSGNIGATNVLRTGNKSLAAMTLFFDTMKGTFAVLIAKSLATPEASEILIGSLGGLSAFLGHLFPLWLKFKGGKGVATYIGVLLGIFWPAAGVFCGVWLIFALVTRLSSLSALIASIITPFYIFFSGHILESLLLGIMSVFLIWKHQSNIRRLLDGTEPRIGKNAT
ncbi:MAG: glycerol-3-phosphate 1-O-acyltransferase PlsY [Hyphomicrobium sp.]